MEPTRDFRLGVLFVHGIGTQPWGDTLVRWGDALVKTIDRGTRSNAQVIVERAGPSEDSVTKPAEAHLTIEWDHHRERWLLSESWWAESFPQPTYRELVSWSLRALPWAVALHFARGYWRDASSNSMLAQSIAFIRASSKLLVMLLFTPVIMLLMGLSLVIGALPPLRGWVLAMQSGLTSTMGDTLAFVESPVRAALIRTRILEQVKDLVGRCERTIVVAHSQGAAAVLDALGGIADDTERRDSHLASYKTVPNTLVTFGAGINQLVSLRVISAGLAHTEKGGSVYIVMAFALGLAAAAAWLTWRVLSHQTTMTSILLAMVLVAAGFLVTIGLPAAVIAMIESRAERSPFLGRHRLSISLITFFGMLIGFSLGMSALDARVVDIDNAIIPLGVFVMLLASIGTLLSKELEQSVKKPVLSPPGLKRWIDLHASADPVPNGPTATRWSGMPEDVPIWNRGSILTDHTTYWENVDGFVLRVVAACADTARSPWAATLSHEWSGIDARARWRVCILQLARGCNLALWAAMGALLLWTGQQAQIPVPSIIPEWIPEPAAKPALLIVLLACGAWASYALMFAFWEWWVHSEQRAALTQNAITGPAFLPLLGMGTVVSTLALVVTGLGLIAFVDPQLPFTVYHLLSFPILGFLLALPLRPALLKLMPPPGVAGRSQEPAAPPVQSVGV